MTCLTCHHPDPHTGGGLGVCLHAGCGCDGPTTEENRVKGEAFLADWRAAKAAPMQRAVDAAVEALESSHGSLEDVARQVVTAAWPHLRDGHDYNDLERIRTLRQALAARNAEIGILNETLKAETAIADRLAEALRLPDTIAGGGQAGWDRTQAALAVYDAARSV